VNWQLHSAKKIDFEILELDDNLIGAEGAFSVSDMLQHNISLKRLHLCGDSVGEKGVRQLINSLKHNQTLSRLWLPKKFVGTYSSAFFSAMTKHRQKLVYKKREEGVELNTGSNLIKREQA